MTPIRRPDVLCLRSFLWTSGLPKFSTEVWMPVAQALPTLDVLASSKFSRLGENIGSKICTLLQRVQATTVNGV